MANKISLPSPPGKLTKEEALKCLRDAVFTSIAILLPQIQMIAEDVDYGEHTLIAMLILGAFFPFINRFLRDGTK